MKNITVNIPKPFDACIQVLIGLGLYKSRSDAIRKGVKKYLHRELKTNLGLFNYPEINGMEIITLGMPEDHIDALEMIGRNDAEADTLYPSRSETIRVAIREFLLEELPRLCKLDLMSIDDLKKKIESILDGYKSGKRLYDTHMDKHKEPLKVEEIRGNVSYINEEKSIIEITIDKGDKSEEVNSRPMEQELDEETEQELEATARELIEEEPFDDKIIVEDGEKVFEYEKLTEVIETITINETTNEGKKSLTTFNILKKLN